MVKEMFGSKKFMVAMIAICGAVLAACLAIPSVAMAADWPGADEDDVASGNTATTEMYLRVDDTQLSFTAPTRINFTMDGAGNFITPDAGVAYFKNNSIMPIKVKSYVVTPDSIAKGMATASGNDANTYQVSVSAKGDTTFPFAISSTGILPAANWQMMQTGKTGDTLGLAFANGKMINCDDAGSWGGAEGHHLQKVEWTVTADLDA